MTSARVEHKIARYHPFLEHDEQILLPPLEGSTIRSTLTWIPFHIGEFLETFVGRTRLILVTGRQWSYSRVPSSQAVPRR